MRIEIIGIIGAGKSSLAKLLLEAYSGSVFEEFKANPFWKAFYLNPEKYAFETEVTFLLQHYHELKRKLEEHNNVVCDYSFLQDLAYARIGLSGKELDIFLQVHSYIEENFGEPDLIIHLKCPLDEARRRIKARGRPEEEFVHLGFLRSLDYSINSCVEEKRNSSVRLNYLEIDTSLINIISNNSDRLSVLNSVKDAIK